MATLVLNIGKSDLLLKSNIYDGYWIPVGFDRDEPNLKTSQASDIEKKIWSERQDIVVTEYYEELGLKEPPKDKKGNYIINFRELTEAVWKTYDKDNEEYWHNTIRPSGRITGVIETILAKFKLEEVYVFVTDQKQLPKGHNGDSCFSFQIFQKWFSKERKFEHLKFEPIALEFDPRPQDKTLEFYYDSLNKLIISKKINENNILAISIKGGTPQMQTALQMQAIASGIYKQLFIEPKVDISKILRRENSECKIISYWRYSRSQTYQSIKLLLNERWDFDGAKVILDEWSRTLSFVQQHIENDGENELKGEKVKIDKVIKKLGSAVDNLNLANKELDSVERLLNIYTQCRLYWDSLNQVANFLARLGTFCEEALQLIIRELDTNNYCLNTERNKDWILDENRITSKYYPEVINAFAAYTDIKSDPQLWIFKQNRYQLNWENFSRYRVERGIKVENRYRKRCLAKFLADIQDKEEKKDFWHQIEKSLNSLDYWAKKRNKLIHGGEGLSKTQMIKDFEREQNKDSTCHPNQIIQQMTFISYYTLKLIGKPNKIQYLNIHNPEKASYYIYSQIKEQVIKDLMTN